jgi:hypothetical protein
LAWSAPCVPHNSQPTYDPSDPLGCWAVKGANGQGFLLLVLCGEENVGLRVNYLVLMPHAYDCLLHALKRSLLPLLRLRTNKKVIENEGCVLLCLVVTPLVLTLPRCPPRSSLLVVLCGLRLSSSRLLAHGRMEPFQSNPNVTTLADTKLMKTKQSTLLRTLAWHDKLEEEEAGVSLAGWWWAI